MGSTDTQLSLDKLLADARVTVRESAEEPRNIEGFERDETPVEIAPLPGLGNLLEEARANPERYEIDAAERLLRRIMATRAGGKVVSIVPISGAPSSDTPDALFDAAWLRLDQRPANATPTRLAPVKVVDLFCGCGGMTLGISEACRALGLEMECVLASDIDPIARQTYNANFHPQHLLEDVTQEVLDGSLGDEPTSAEKILAEKVGTIDLLVGGPPCQGHSNLNNHTRRNDPKNRLIESMARFAEVVDVRHIIIENVPTVLNDQTRSIHTTKTALMGLGYRVESVVLNAADYGVAQQRKRYFLVASKDLPVNTSMSHHLGLRQLGEYRVTRRSFGWACEGLECAIEGNFDTPPQTSEENKQRIEFLFDKGDYNLRKDQRPECHRNGTTYTAVYGRLKWNEPSPTITRGFGSMGQGRYVHPHCKRLITPHEAARLQFFPDFFDFGNPPRKRLQYMIGNAVPPKLIYLLALHLLR
ncbi:MAG: DNA cytosine methyltransferase [Chloroflexi bacterium]|jgi:DNA (cytosine-5)-methyltransferase 1|nr:DNA cytosine methyltransferase [Chloroflexota bacterium]